MPFIMHYISMDNSGREYVVITDDEDIPHVREANRMPDFKHNGSYEIEDTGVLPTDRPLFPR